MEKCIIAYFVSFKCEEGKHYNSSYQLCQRFCLLGTSYGEYKAARTCEDFQRGEMPGFFNSTQRIATAKNIKVKQSHYRPDRPRGFQEVETPRFQDNRHIIIQKTVLKPVWTHGIELWSCASNSNIEIIQRYQSKILRILTNAPWY